MRGPERHRVARAAAAPRRIADLRAACRLHAVGAMLIPQDPPPHRRRFSAVVRRLVIVIVGAAVFLITPYFLYEQLSAFQFGAEEMRAAVRGTWRLELSPEAGRSRSITFTLDQAASPARAERERAWIRTASACGSRTLIRSAEACEDVTHMPLTLVAIGGDRSLSPTAKLSVLGKTFERGQLELEVGERTIRASISRTGEVLSVDAHHGTASLTRLEAPAAAR